MVLARLRTAMSSRAFCSDGQSGDHRAGRHPDQERGGRCMAAGCENMDASGGHNRHLKARKCFHISLDLGLMNLENAQICIAIF